mmetsp:Transcript_24549/g.50772  ORF Transcript_24549/g.50772 Transcript_24549/m.50772 type:complete len:595 (-) Transcript_24549:381-2165(-)
MKSTLTFFLVATFAREGSSFARSPRSHSAFVPSLQVHRTTASTRRFLSTQPVVESNTTPIDPQWNLKIAIAGAGPSGLVLAHRLLQQSSASSLPISAIDIYESRADPRAKLTSSLSLGGRAYALGLGIRGRSAIRTVDEELWGAVKARGFECERFRLHLTKSFNIKLRDDDDQKNKIGGEGIEPSVLIYQTDLCGALLDELERRDDQGKVNLHFNSNITHVDLLDSTITLQESAADNRNNNSQPDRKSGPYDLIVGCDGANSVVRTALQTYSPPNTFASTQRKLYPGCFKVARVEKMPPLMDPASVALILPEKKSLGVTAFVEPVVGGGGCILFAGKLPEESKPSSSSNEGNQKDDDSETEEINLATVLFSDCRDFDVENSSDVSRVEQLMIEQFPLLEGTPGLENAVKQLLSQRSSVASSVKCNTYSSAPIEGMTPAALCGDAAHATGGVSGQGCNSAIADSVALADGLIEYYRPLSSNEEDIPKAKRGMLHQSLAAYSRTQVPEGLALYDLSFGNDGKSLPPLRNLIATLNNALDSVFRGRWGIGKKPLQTFLTSSMTPFSEIRRERQKYYLDEFPSAEWFDKQLESVYSES